MSQAEQFWAGEFGDEYAERSPGNVQANTAFFARVLERARGVESVLELGAGVGNNLRAIRRLMPGLYPVDAVEVNESACKKLEPVVDQLFRCSLLELARMRAYDLTFTKGVLIHIPPERLFKAYAALWQYSRRYILVAEYYNQTTVELDYRGHKGRLWKRDFAGEILSIYGDLRLVDYGFVYHRDVFPQDDLTWFLMEKRP